MVRMWVCLVLSGAFVVAAATDAEARRRGFRVPIFVSTGGSSVSLPPKVVKVRNWPDTKAFRRRSSGTYVDLGWRFEKGSRTAGKWVGYIGSSRRYVALSQRQVDRLNRQAGFSSLPKSPSRSGSSIGGGSSGWIWVMIGVIVLGGGWKFLRPIVLGGTAVANMAGRAVGSRQRAEKRSNSWDRADELISTKAMARGPSMADDEAPPAAQAAGPKPRPRIGTPAKPARKPNMARTAAAGMRTSPGFGRRG